MKVDWQILTEDTLIADVGKYRLHAEERDVGLWVWSVVRSGRTISRGETIDAGAAMAEAEIELNKAK